MSEAYMSREQVTIEVDGRTLQAPKGAMLIEVTDRHEIYVPRFCYHPLLSVAANCRMCLVEVEKAPKPLPACATPVMEGMKAYTRSPAALEAQRSVMEFLLINHPLDCPICDQGGECELQDLAMGFGRDVSRYQERKRVVADQNIGPLVQTDMTRCIHCTRCVRFGEEIAGLRELGATGRSEHMEIGTYVEKSMRSELSGNVIDLCPVGALTSKPFRYSARAWEMRQYSGVAPHDGVGSNLEVHVKDNRVKRVIPATNDAINEAWLSDRDRFSYEGLYSPDRLSVPEIRENGKLRPVSWEEAFDFAYRCLTQLVKSHQADQLGALVSPSATLEECYLFQTLVRGLGSPHVDHRLRRWDFTGQEREPTAPLLGCSLADLERADAVLLVGAWPRKEQPLLNHRLRKAALGGAAIMAINSLDYDFNYELAARIIVRPSGMPAALAGVLKATLQRGKQIGDVSLRAKLESLLKQTKTDKDHRQIAALLSRAKRSGILFGPSAQAHPAFSILRQLGLALRDRAGGFLGHLPDGANAVGASLAGALPHRGPCGEPARRVGLTARAMLERGCAGWLLLGMEPELDVADGLRAHQALASAQSIVALTGYRTPLLERHAHVLLPIALFAENEGTLVNVEGRLQGFRSASRPPGEARPAWKILRMLGKRLRLAGFEHPSCARVLQELQHRFDRAGAGVFDGEGTCELQDLETGSLPAPCEAPECYSDLPMHATDPLVRRAPSLQATADAGNDEARLHPAYATQLKLRDRVRVRRNGVERVLKVALDTRVPEGGVHLYAGRPETAVLGPPFGVVRLEPA